MYINNKMIIQDKSTNRSFIDNARREQIIHHAIETIAMFGYGQTSFAKIARKAKISIGVISYHFSNKEELINQIVLSIYKAGADFMTPRIEFQKNATAALRSYIESNIEFITQHPTEMLALAQILPNFRNDEGHLVFNQKTEEPIIESLEELLSWGQKTGEFREFDRRVMAITIRRAIDGFPMQLEAKPELNAAEYASELATIFEKASRI